MPKRIFLRDGAEVVDSFIVRHVNRGRVVRNSARTALTSLFLPDRRVGGRVIADFEVRAAYHRVVRAEMGLLARLWSRLWLKRVGN
jgi:hypothetical protein